MGGGEGREGKWLGLWLFLYLWLCGIQDWGILLLLLECWTLTISLAWGTAAPEYVDVCFTRGEGPPAAQRE